MQQSLSVADRISELEKQKKFSYLDPDKKHKIPDPTLKAIQKKALLSFYERHHNNPNKSNVWHSEPQLAQSQPALSAAPQPPPRVKVQFPSRRASSAADYAAANSSRRSSLASARENKSSDRQTPKHQHSNSCGSLSTDLLGPVIMGPSISVDDYIPDKPPERPPKNPHLRTAYPDLFQTQRIPSPDLPPPSPPTVLEDEVFHNDEPLPPPPTDLETSDWQQEFQDRLKENATTGNQFAAPQVEKSSKSNYYPPPKDKMESPIKETCSFLERNSNRYASVRSSIRSRPLPAQPQPQHNKSPGDKSKQSIEQLNFPSQRNHVENSSTRYPSMHKLVLNGNIAVSQKVANGSAEQYRAEPLHYKPDRNGQYRAEPVRNHHITSEKEEKTIPNGQYRAEPVRTHQYPSPNKEEPSRIHHSEETTIPNDCRAGYRASIAESTNREVPPPLQPRQMRINQSMRARISESRPGNMIRTSPPKDRREPKPLNYTM